MLLVTHGVVIPLFGSEDTWCYYVGPYILVNQTIFSQAVDQTLNLDELSTTFLESKGIPQTSSTPQRGIPQHSGNVGDVMCTIMRPVLALYRLRLFIFRSLNHQKTTILNGWLRAADKLSWWVSISSPVSRWLWPVNLLTNDWPLILYFKLLPIDQMHFWLLVRVAHVSG